jgi:hypothetical protein
VGIKEEIDRIRQQETDRREAEEQGREIAKRRKELENAQARREAAERAEQGKESQEKEAQKSPQPEVQSAPASEAALDWQHQKEIEGAQNSSLDDLMGMIGLEAVKEQFLEIKAKVDLLVRQDLSLENERFGAALLGNPGTGECKFHSAVCIRRLTPPREDDRGSSLCLVLVLCRRLTR